MRRFLGFWATLACVTFAGQAQQIAQLDFFAHAGRCEIDHDKDGRDDNWWIGASPEVDRTPFRTALDYAVKYEGLASQQLEFQRTEGAAGWVSLSAGVGSESFLKPAPGEPVLVRFAFRAEGFQNATYRISIVTGGNWHTIVESSNQSTNQWREVSAVVPAGDYSNRLPIFSLIVTFDIGQGAAAGRFWIDDVRAISARTVMRTSTLPNSMKLCLIFLYRNGDGYQYLNGLPFGIIIGMPHAEQVFRRHYADVISAPYVYCAGTLHAPHARHNSDLYNYDDVRQNHPDWFLRDQQGRPYTSDVATYMDLGRPEVRERAWQSLRDFLNRCGRPRYVYLDGVNMRYGLPGENIPQNYPNNGLWAQAFNGWFEYVGSRVRTEFNGTQFIVNAPMGPGYWLRGIPGYSSDAPGIPTLPYIAGFLLEHAFTHARMAQGLTTIQDYGSNATNSTPGVGTGPGNWAAWILRNQIRLATEHPDKIMILIPTLWLHQPDTPQKLRFAIAGCLIVQHDNTYVYIDPRRNQQEYPNGFFPPELFVPLGRWTENYRILNGDIVSGGLFVRNYENGIVVWNPTHNRDFTFTVPRDLYDWDRNLIRAGTVVQIPRQTGHVFYSAPEITLELSPQNAQVLPGQTVQFTVTYRNRGTAPGTNVRVAVPLPQGMTLVGSNPQARLENGQVVWIVPNVPVGGQGTLQFTVRVE